MEKAGEIFLAEEGLIRRAYGIDRITEGYHCNYGLNPECTSRLFSSGLTATAHDASGDIRAVELSTHPFFVATLFQPERRALRGEAPPLVAAFVAAQAFSLSSRLTKGFPCTKKRSGQSAQCVIPMRGDTPVSNACTLDGS